MLALYHNDMSLCAQKVRVCLAEKKLSWEDRHIVLRSRDEWPKVQEIMRAA
jgi:glutathione S-transferase